jgi:hypothetical protein
MSQGLDAGQDLSESPPLRADVDVIVRLGGRYVLASRRGRGGQARRLACRAVRISTTSMTLAVPVCGDLGERVVAHFDELGKLQGAITRVLDGGFIMSIVATDEQRAKLAARLSWLDKHRNMELRDGRRQKRIIPDNPHSTIILADGSILGCFVIDLSTSGAAVSAEFEPEIGLPLAIGRVVGRVVRRFPEGFAVKFIELQAPDALEQLIIKPLAAQTLGAA